VTKIAKRQGYGNLLPCPPDRGVHSAVLCGKTLRKPEPAMASAVKRGSGLRAQSKGQNF